MTERRERIPAEEISDAKNWNLPFWTEPESVVKAREKEQEVEAETVVEDEEIEIEPLTAEQLEQIRQEAYNEGLQQGLVEGRQKGEKLGHAEGHKDGLIQGQEEGRKVGLEAGTEHGKTQALLEGKKQTDDTVTQLKSVLTSLEEQLSEQKQAIDELLPELVIMLSRAVVSQELDQGSEHIVALVKAALDALPIGATKFSIDVNALDLPFLDVAFKGTDLSACLTKNDTVQAGGCQVLSEYSTVDFSLSERWKSVLANYQRQLQLGLLDTQSSDDNIEPSDSVPSDIDGEPQPEASTPAQSAQPEPLIADASIQEPSANIDSSVNTQPAKNPEPSAQQTPSEEQTPPTNSDDPSDPNE